MHIATWNFNGALRTKLDASGTLKFDVAVIQECEEPAHFTSASYKALAKYYLWAGTNTNKGIGVFATPEVKLEPVDLDLGQLQSFLPCTVQDHILLVAT